MITVIVFIATFIVFVLFVVVIIFVFIFIVIVPNFLCRDFELRFRRVSASFRGACHPP